MPKLYPFPMLVFIFLALVAPLLVFLFSVRRYPLEHTPICLAFVFLISSYSQPSLSYFLLSLAVYIASYTFSITVFYYLQGKQQLEEKPDTVEFFMVIVFGYSMQALLFCLLLGGMSFYIGSLTR